VPTYTQIYYHIVFSTKNREPVLNESLHEHLFRYIWGIVNNQRCHLYAINGAADHLHILSSLHPSTCLADLVKSVKTASSLWIKTNHALEGFTHWQDGYGAFTHSTRDKASLIAYIEDQENHHRQVSFRDELRRLLREAEVQFDERYLL